MKEITNITLLLYEKTLAKIKLDGIKNNWLKLGATLLMFPFMNAFVIVALCIEEPIKILIFLLLFQTTPIKAWKYYKKCWGALIFGIRSNN